MGWSFGGIPSSVPIISYRPAKSNTEQTELTHMFFAHALVFISYYCIREDGKIVGGLVLKIDEESRHNELELLFVHPDEHSKGIGYAAWQEVERLYPETKVWETCTPYFETRNIHFYVNKCGFHVVEFFNSHHHGLHNPEIDDDYNNEGENDFDGMFRFEKQMK